MVARTISARNSRTSAVILTALCFMLASTAQAAVKIENVDAKGGRAALVLAPDASATVGAIVAHYQVGSFEDDQTYGLTRLTQRALIDANAALGRPFLEELYAAGAQLELTTSVRGCSFILSAPKRSFKTLAGKLLRGLHNPRFTKADLRRVQRLTYDDQLQGGGVDDLVSMLAGEILIAEVSKGGGDYRNPPRGDRASVAELSMKDVKRHASRFFVPANLTVYGAGTLDKKFTKTLKKLRGGKRNLVKRGSIAGLPRELERYSRRELHLHAQALQIDSIEELAAARVLEALVWDRMMWKLRRQGVTYSPSVVVAMPPWQDLLIIVVPVSNSRERGIRVEPLLRKYLDQLIVSVPDPDYIRNRDHVINTMLQTEANPAALVRALARGGAKVPWHHSGVQAAVANLKKEDFLRIVRAWLGPERSINFLYGRSRAKYKRRK